jgi:predicted  nucleic acid-binding Zn-ribbon protein
VNDIETRLLKLEYRMDDHSDELKKLQDISETLKRSLIGIEKTLAQIKWLATGAFVAFFAQSMGLDKALKLLLA